MNNRWMITLTCSALLTAGCDGNRFTAEERSQFQIISKGINRATTLTLYEGLTHQSFEMEEFKGELATKKTILLHGFPFYERTLAVRTNDLQALRLLSSATGTFSHYGGPKNCGGYHPDYCLQWRDGENAYDLLICFGCHEMQLYGPKQELLTDVQREHFDQFKTVLSKYRDQRPKPKWEQGP